MNTRSKGLTEDDHEHTLIVNRREVSSKSQKDKNKKPPTASEAENNQATEDVTLSQNTQPHSDRESFEDDLTDQTQVPVKPDTPYPFRRLTIEGPTETSYQCLADIPEEEDPKRDSPFRNPTPKSSGKKKPPPPPPPTHSTPYPPKSPYSASRRVLDLLTPFRSALYQSPLITIPELSDSHIESPPVQECTPQSSKKVRFDTSTPLNPRVRRHLNFSFDENAVTESPPPSYTSEDVDSDPFNMADKNKGAGQDGADHQPSAPTEADIANEENRDGGADHNATGAAAHGYEQEKHSNLHESMAAHNGSILEMLYDDADQAPPPYGNTYYPQMDEVTAEKFRKQISQDETLDQNERLRLQDLIHQATRWTILDPGDQPNYLGQPCFYQHPIGLLPISQIVVPTHLMDPKEDKSEEIDTWFRVYVRDYVNLTAEQLLKERQIIYYELARAISCLRQELQGVKVGRGRPAVLHHYYCLVLRAAMVETTISIALYDKLLPHENELDLEREERTKLYSQLDGIWLKAMDLIRSSTLVLPMPGAHINPGMDRPELIPLPRITPAKRLLDTLEWNGRGNKKDAKWLHNFVLIQKSGKFERMIKHLLKSYTEEEAKTYLDNYHAKDKSIVKEHWIIAQRTALFPQPSNVIFRATIHRINTGSTYQADLDQALNYSTPQPAVLERMKTDTGFRRHVMAYALTRGMSKIQGPRMDRLKILTDAGAEYIRSLPGPQQEVENTAAIQLFMQLFKEAPDHLHETTPVRSNLTMRDDTATEAPGLKESSAPQAYTRMSSGPSHLRTASGGGGDDDPDDDPKKSRKKADDKAPPKDKGDDFPLSAADAARRGLHQGRVTAEDLNTSFVSTYTTASNLLGSKKATPTTTNPDDQQKLKEDLDKMSTLPTKGKVYAGYTKNTDFNLDDVKPPEDLADTARMNQFYLAQNLFKDDTLPCRQFSGKRIDWFEFWDEFTSNVDRNGKFRTITKFAKLRALIPENVYIYIQHLPMREEYYEEAKNTLIERFGQIKPYITLLKTRFKNNLAPLQPHQPHSLTRFYGLVAKTIQQLAKYSPTDLHNDDLLLHAQRQMDESTYRRWQKFLEKVLDKCQSDPILFEEGKYDALISFLKREMDVQDDLAINHANPDPPPKAPAVPSNRRNKRGSRRARFNAYMVEFKENVTITCFYCGKDHKYFPICPHTTQAERMKMIREEDRCRRCLKKGHHTKDCTSTSTCLSCQSPNHHVTLCNKPIVTSITFPKNSTNGTSDKKGTKKPKNNPQSNNGNRQNTRQSNRNSNQNRRQNPPNNQNRSNNNSK